MAILQRFRSGDRDRSTDTARLGAVRDAVLAARLEARRERDGLRGRAERAGQDAAMAADGDHDERQEGRIGRAEATMRGAEARLAVLDRQIAGLDAVLATLDGLEGPQGRPAP